MVVLPRRGASVPLGNAADDSPFRGQPRSDQPLRKAVVLTELRPRPARSAGRVIMPAMIHQAGAAWKGPQQASGCGERLARRRSLTTVEVGMW